MRNVFIKYNTSMLINVFMSRKYKYVCDREFIPKYSDINKRDYYYGWSSLSLVFYRNLENCINVARLLLTHPKINVNVQTEFGTSPLMSACGWEKTTIAKLLLSHPKIDVNIKNNNGETALYYASIENNKELINLLRQHNAQ